MESQMDERRSKIQTSCIVIDKSYIQTINILISQAIKLNLFD